MKWAYYPAGDITQLYGESPELYQKYVQVKQKDGSIYILQGHSGIDIVRPHGEHIYAVEGGKVKSVKDDPKGYGKHVKIRTPEDDYGVSREWVYSHLSSIYVKEGEKVAPGRFIAKMGNTGFVVSSSDANGFWDYNPYRGTHLHLAVRDWHKGRVVDYKNGYFGRYDFLHKFVPKHKASYKLIQFSKDQDDKDKKLLNQASLILQKLGL